MPDGDVAARKAELARLSAFTVRQIERDVRRVYKGHDEGVGRFISQVCLVIAQLEQLGNGVSPSLLPRQGSLMLVGPTGCGKTALASATAEALGIHFMVIDCTDLTGAGWKGGDISERLGALASWQSKHPGKATLLLFDEFDKLVRKDDRYPSFDPQNSLLKFFDGGVQDIPAGDGFRSAGTLDSTLVIPVLCGAFTGIERIIRARIDGSPAARDLMEAEGVRSLRSVSDDAVRELVTRDDLKGWGFKIELLGRLSDPIVLPAPTPDLFVSVLLDGDTALIKRYERLLPLGCRIHMTEAGASALALDAINAGTGIRGLDTRLRAMVADVRARLLEDETLLGVMIDADRMARIELLWIADDGSRKRAAQASQADKEAWKDLEGFDRLIEGKLSWSRDANLLPLVGRGLFAAIADVLLVYEPAYARAVKGGCKSTWDGQDSKNLALKMLVSSKPVLVGDSFGEREVLYTALIAQYCLVARGRHYRVRDRSLNEMPLSAVLRFIHAMVEPLDEDDPDDSQTVFQALMAGAGPAMQPISFMGRYEHGEYGGDELAEKLVRGYRLMRAMPANELRMLVRSVLRTCAELDGERMTAWFSLLEAKARERSAPS